MKTLMLVLAMCGAGELDDPAVKKQIEAQRTAEIKRLTLELEKLQNRTPPPKTKVAETQRALAFLKNSKNAYLPELASFQDGEVGTLYNKSAKVVEVIDGTSAVVKVEVSFARTGGHGVKGGTWRDRIVKGVSTSGWNFNDLVKLPQVFKVTATEDRKDGKRTKKLAVIEPISTPPAEKSPKKQAPKKPAPANRR